MAAPRGQARRPRVSGVQRAVTAVLMLMLMLMFRAAVLVLRSAGRRADIGGLRRRWRGCVHRCDQNAIRLGPYVASGRRGGVTRRFAISVVHLLAVSPFAHGIGHGEP